MTGQWRARVEADDALDGVAVHLRRRLDDQNVEVVTPVMLGFDRIITEPGAATVAAPMLRLSDEQGLALLDALMDHYGDGHTIRAELVTLTARTSELLGVLTERIDKLVTHMTGGRNA